MTSTEFKAYTNVLADKFAAKIERTGGAVAKTAGECLALRSDRFEETGECANQGWGRMEIIWRVKR